MRRQCKLCRLYFINGYPISEIPGHLGLSENRDASEMMKSIWPDFDFMGYSTMRKHGIRPWTQVRDEDGDKIKQLHVDHGLGYKAIADKIGVSRGIVHRILSDADWYDPNKAKAHITIRKFIINRFNGSLAVTAKWQNNDEQRETQRLRNRTRTVNELPLFDLSAKERAR